MKRVAFYYPWIHLRSGVEHMILELLRRTRHRVTVFTSHLDYEHTFPEFRHVRDIVELRRVSVRRSVGAVLAAAGTIASQRLPLHNFDVLLVSSEGLGDFITFRNRSVPALCYCHSLVRPVYDAVYRASLGERRPLLRWSLPPFLPAYRALTRRAWARYRHVFANSRVTREHILEHRLSPPEKVEVLHPGVDPPRVEVGEHEKFFLYAGRIKWTKNVELAIRGFLEFRKRNGATRSWSLVVAGEVDPTSTPYLRELQALGASDQGVVYQPNLSREALERLFASCYALVYPSLNEPWGIVPVEAMAYRRPVLAVNRGGPTESIIDGETGFLLEPSPGAFADRMLWLAEHPEALERMGAAAARRAAEFSWDTFVRRLDDCIETLG